MNPTGTYEEVWDACERNASTEEFIAICAALDARYPEKSTKIYLRALQDWEFYKWSDEERDIQCPGWRDW